MIVASLMFSSQAAAAAAGHRHAAAAVRWGIKAHARIYIYGYARSTTPDVVTVCL